MDVLSVSLLPALVNRPGFGIFFVITQPTLPQVIIDLRRRIEQPQKFAFTQKTCLNLREGEQLPFFEKTACHPVSAAALPNSYRHIPI